MEKLPHFQRNYLFESQQEWIKNHPEITLDKNQLHVLGPNGDLLSGTCAWEILIEQEPLLKKFMWIAEKIGMAPQSFAKLLEKSGQGIRRLCLSCRQ